MQLLTVLPLMFCTPHLEDTSAAVAGTTWGGGAGAGAASKECHRRHRREAAGEARVVKSRPKGVKSPPKGCDLHRREAAGEARVSRTEGVHRKVTAEGRAITTQGVRFCSERERWFALTSAALDQAWTPPPLRRCCGRARE
eukprot:9503963-Pyramimonas_sp.AAC.1